MKTLKNIKRHSKTKKRVFSKKDFNSGDGFLTKVWGPIFWTALHIVSFNYPNEPTSEDKTHYRDYVLNLQYTLPCKYCRINLRNNLKKRPLTMSHMKNRETFSRYIYDLHETINKLLNKKSNLTYNDVRERYEHFRSRCTNETKTKTNPIILKKSKSSKNSITKKNKKETGCTEPLYGKKSKCIINIVPQENKSKTFKVDKNCEKRRN
jgi:hypothetical protein